MPPPLSPYIKDSELIIPTNSDPKYHYWAGGQSLVDTLRELRVSREVWSKYTERPYWSEW